MIKGFIDGKLISQTEDKLPCPDELCYCASTENSTSDIILKVVNVNPDTVKSKIELDDRFYNGTLYQLSHYDLNSENTFASPEKITPKQYAIAPFSGNFIYQFPPYSISVFRMKII